MRPGPDPWEDGRDYARRLAEEDRDSARADVRAERNLLLQAVGRGATPERVARLHAHRVRYPWVREVELHYSPPVGLHPDARAWLAAWVLRWAVDKLSMREAA